MQNLLTLLICTLIPHLAFSQDKNFIDLPHLRTTATVDSSVIPDRIYLSIIITEADTKGKISVEELENKMATTLTSLGIDLEKQLKLTDLASNFKKYFLQQKDVLKSKSYELLVYDGLTAGRVIVALENINISNTNLERTEYSRIEELKLHLLGKAVEKAKQQAVAMLQPLMQNPGKAIYVSENKVAGLSTGIYVIQDKARYEPIEIEFEKIPIETMVEVIFKLD